MSAKRRTGCEGQSALGLRAAPGWPPSQKNLKKDELLEASFPQILGAEILMLYFRRYGRKEGQKTGNPGTRPAPIRSIMRAPEPPRAIVSKAARPMSARWIGHFGIRFNALPQAVRSICKNVQYRHGETRSHPPTRWRILAFIYFFSHDAHR